MYKHHDLILAWLNNQPVQYLLDSEWIDLQKPSHVDKLPHFYTNREYRLKPLEKRSRTALVLDKNHITKRVATTLLEEYKLAHTPGFINWLGGWKTENSSVDFSLKID